MNALLMVAAIAAAQPVKDPFWPIGYEGTRHVISAEPRLAPEPGEPVVASEPEKEREDVVKTAGAGDDLGGRWEVARRLLKFGGLLQMRSDDGAFASTALMVNGTPCRVGDVIRIENGGYRFSWRIERNEDERKLKLVRIKAVRLEDLKEEKK